MFYKKEPTTYGDIIDNYKRMIWEFNDNILGEHNGIETNN